MKTIIKIFLFLTNFIPSIKAKRERNAIAQEFIEEVDTIQSHKDALEQKMAAARQKTRHNPFKSTAYDYLFGFGFNPSQEQLDRLVQIAKQTRSNGWKWIDARFIAATITGKINLEHTLTGGLDQALDIAENYNWGTIKKRDLPGRNEKCTCGSDTKFKNCCLKKTA
jgi:uncharacterized protein YchJ